LTAFTIHSITNGESFNVIPALIRYILVEVAGQIGNMSGNAKSLKDDDLAAGDHCHSGSGWQWNSSFKFLVLTAVTSLKFLIYI
jgi:hypothetical protein